MTKALRVAIVGSRDYQHLDRVRFAVNCLPPHCVIVSGGARGVDTIAGREALVTGRAIRVYHPQWALYGKSAGMIRNRDIIGDSDIVIAFYDGGSKGTANSIMLARKMNKPLTIIYDEEWV